jgi:hypothetical protein
MTEDLPSAMGWPKASWRWVPALEDAVELACEVRRRVWGLGPYDPVGDLGRLMVAGKFDLCEADLAVDRGGHEALMFPGTGGQLLIRIDARPRQPWGTSCDTLRQQTRRHRLRFRVAHEVAHSFFYERDDHGARRRRRSTPAEERFCDHFASTLLVPATAVRALPATAESVLALHERFDVSIETAARRLAEVHETLDVAVGFWREHESRTAGNLQPQWSSEKLARCGEQALRAALGDERSPWETLTAAHPAPPRRQLVVVGCFRARDPLG